MIANLHEINQTGQIMRSLLPFAMAFLKLAYILCVQIVRKQLCLHNFSQLFGGFMVKTLLRQINILVLNVSIIYVKKMDFEKKWPLHPFAMVGQLSLNHLTITLL